MPQSNSPFTPILENSGTAPSSSQKYDDTLSVHDYTNELALIEAEILRLEARRLELKGLIDNHQALSISRSPPPQPSLPGDVWAEVFLHCIPVDPPPSPNKAEPPLLFTTISRSWREIALNTPHLWTCMTILLPPLPGTHLFAPVKERYRRMVNQRISGIRSWLDRSGSLLPLTLAIRDLPVRGEMDQMDPEHPAHAHCETFRDYMGIVFSYAGRLSKVMIDSRSLHAYQSSPYGIGCDPSPTQLPLLGDLEISSRNWGRVTDLHRKLVACPSLRALTLRPGHDRILQGLPVHWSSLLRLELRPRDRFNSVSWSEILPVLAQCSRLQSLVIGVASDRSDLSRIITSLQTPINLPDLRSLCLGGSISDGEATLLAFSTLLTPSLLDLSIRWTYPWMVGRTMEWDFISDLLARSNCQLVSLSLRLPMPETSMIELLRSIPTLNNLDLDEIKHLYSGPDSFTITEALLGALSPNLSPLAPPSVCPNLEHLSLTFFRWKRHTRTIISSFARTWKTAIASGDPELGRLKSVTVKWADVQPVRQPIENILEEDPDVLLDWKPVWNYFERDRGSPW
ncbi:hypothetical protein V5O48_008731 [Marasmius crinis-equi]|uniref:F-box domain-containing protein n=1 Tax=Marasmius crinis-equi TaxID=585013 RepID=A0ABR3FDF6_9AGAR